jgi:hypothetical protein
MAAEVEQGSSTYDEDRAMSYLWYKPKPSLVKKFSLFCFAAFAAISLNAQTIENSWIR